ncbi:UNVERIFIED_CONTAM: hypothetical protein Slati_0856800 [Sesamum latifolium]|uniref:Integrase catalytic domain-containing protein n=1 Tax=Sesamum latifolium TaxID=2727402 RepID=A0AAW2XQX8_9LAMI
MAHETGAKHLLAYSDSQLVVKQVEGTYEAKEEKEGIHILQEIHSGCCGAHVGTRILANKALRAGYFWPTMKQDAIRLVSKCERCQKHSSLMHQPAEPLTTMLSPCPFRQWGIDIVGRFPLAAGQRKFLLVAVDYFTKWVEAEPLARITEGEVMKFIWKNIICRFGIPREIISDNGRQFQGRKIQEWCQGLRIKQRFTTVAHPQANGQVEVTNRILDNPRGSTGETPFSLVYGTEAIILAELGMPSHRVMNFSKECNENLLRENLDLIEELRKKAFQRVQRYKNIMINSYNKRVKSRSFQVGDLVLRRVDALKPIGKLNLTWEGPYKVTSVIGKGAYELEDPEGRPLPRHGRAQSQEILYVNKIPLKDHQVTGAAPLLRSSEGPSIHRGHPPAQAGPSVSLGPEEEGEVPSGTAAGVGGASKGPAGGIAGAFSFFSAGSPSLGTTPSMESVAATGGGDSSLLPPLRLGSYQGHPLIKETDDG